MNSVFLVLGWIALVLGAIGAFLPIMPTTPFVLLAAYFFSKGSARIHRWLLSNKTFGPLIRNWEKHGAISPPAKWGSTITILSLFGWTLYFVPVGLWIKALVAAIGVGVLIFVWTRPNGPPLKRKA